MTRTESGLLALLLLTSAVLPSTIRAQTAGSLQITQVQAGPSGLNLSWPMLATGTAYTVQYQDTLQDGVWRFPASTTPFPLASNGWTDAGMTNTSRFYRVIGVPAAQRGKLLSATAGATLPTSELAIWFLFGGLPVTATYNVELYKLDYETITPLGARTKASGLMLLPVTPAGKELPMVSYQHGTLTQTNSAPSVTSDITGSEVIIGVAFATSGYAVVMPDYLGMGDSPGLHPYLHARSEATACVDMMRAARTACASLNVSLNGRLFLCGYSEGGYVTMSLCRELETYHTNEFSLTACAPMSGPYDLSGVTVTNMLTASSQANPYYFLYVLAAYQDVYHLATSLADLLAAPYATTLPPLMNGNTTSDQLNAAMPANPTAILKPSVLAAFRDNPRHPLRLALEENDVDRWRPRTPMRLYYCTGDEDVDPNNSVVALASFQALGATQVTANDPKPGADHSACAQPSLVSAKAWFDSLR